MSYSPSTQYTAHASHIYSEHTQTTVSRTVYYPPSTTHTPPPPHRQFSIHPQLTQSIPRPPPPPIRCNTQNNNHVQYVIAPSTTNSISNSVPPPPPLKRRKLDTIEAYNGNTKQKYCGYKEWNHYAIIFWLNRVMGGKLAYIDYLNLRKHIFIGKIKGNELHLMNDVILRMIGIFDANQHSMILKL